jgi:hypothetical protein
MRFPQLKIGQQFEYQGKRFTKTGPLTASEEGTGANAMIRRSAEVVLVDNAMADVPIKQLKQNFSREDVAELCQAYRSKLINELQEKVDKDNVIHIESLIITLSEIDPFVND